MNLLDNEETKACSFEQLVVGETYYKVCCGYITSIVYLRDLSGVRYEYMYRGIIHDTYYSDTGIWGAPECSYKNFLNRLFLVEEDATNYVASPEYKKILKDHNRRNYGLELDLGKCDDDGFYYDDLS